MHRRSFLVLGLSFAGIGKSFASGSWQAYADSIVANNLAVCGVIGSCQSSGGYAVWATAGHFPSAPTPQEMQVLAARFANPNNGQKLIIGGKSYNATNCNGDFLTGRNETQGIAVAKSNTVLVIGCTGEGQNQGNCLNNVVKIATGLRASNY